MSGRRAAASVAGLVAVVVAGVVAASFALPATLAYDPWAWLVWGREIGGLELDTTGGPSWKPLPVLAATLVAPLGDGAPTAWLVLVRALSIGAVAGVFQLARRLSGSAAAGAVAAGLLVLTPDHGPRFLRTVLEGHSAPVTAGLAAWAAERHVAGRPAAAFGLLVALGLDRPEAWPFLGAYALWAWRSGRVDRRWLAAGLAAVPLLWFGGDWWGSGSPLHGADAAQHVPSRYQTVDGAVERLYESVISPVWVAAGGAVVAWLWRRRATAAAALTGLALAWGATVVASNVAFGYAALARFYLPGAALLCAAGAVAAADAVRAVPAARWRPAAAAALALAALPTAAGRASNVPELLDEIADRERIDAALVARIEAEGGPAVVRACALPTATPTGAFGPALAWHARVPLHDARDC